jgi:hypothetical protein
VDANEQGRERAKATPLRNEAQLNCVSLRSQFNGEVAYGAVKKPTRIISQLRLRATCAAAKILSNCASDNLQESKNVPIHRSGTCLRFTASLT